MTGLPDEHYTVLLLLRDNVIRQVLAGVSHAIPSLEAENVDRH
jgi:hypothetical protein